MKAREHRLRTGVLALALAGLPLSATWAGPAARPFNPLETFAPLDLSPSPSPYRTGAGTPGPNYWQNRADYRIAARLDPATKTLSGEETITYANNSPDVLPSLWVQLDQNIYRKDSRTAVSSGGVRRGRGGGASTEGYQIASIEVLRGQGWVKVPFVVILKIVPESFGPPAEAVP